MSEDQNAAGASGGGSEVVSGASGSEVTSLSVDDAVERLNARDQADQAGAGGEPVEPTEPSATERAAEPTDASKELPAGGAEGEPGGDQADADALDFENLHGNTKLRLRDGTVVTVSDLKKNWGDLQAYPQRRQAIEAAATELRQRETQTAEQAQVLARILPTAMSVLQRYVPPPPSEEMWDTDPIAAQAQERAHKKAMGELQTLHQAGAQRAQAQQAEQRAKMQQYLEKEGSELFSKMPHLKDTAANREFLTKMTSSLNAAGFKAEEIGEISDHRLFPLIEKVIKYDEMMAAKPKPQPAGRPTPPQAPGRRGAVNDARQSDISSRHQALRSSGSIDDAVAFLNALERK